MKSLQIDQCYAFIDLFILLFLIRFFVKNWLNNVILIWPNKEISPSLHIVFLILITLSI